MKKLIAIAVAVLVGISLTTSTNAQSNVSNRREISSAERDRIIENHKKNFPLEPGQEITNVYFLDDSTYVVESITVTSN